MTDVEPLTRLHHLALVARQLGGGLLRRPAARLPAGGTEITGYRDYAPGDDYRAVDWNICARHDELVVRQFHGEADQHTYLLVDCSRSMGLGKPPKSEAAAKAAVALAYVAMARHEQVSVLAFSDRVLAHWQSAADARRIAGLMRFLENLPPPEGTTDLAHVVGQLVRQRQRPGLAVVISDFCDPSGFQRTLDHLRHRAYAPRVVRIIDPREASADLLGDVELVDVERQTSLDVTVAERHLAEYCRRYWEHRDALRRYCAKYRLGWVELPSDLPENELSLRAIGARQTGGTQP